MNFEQYLSKEYRDNWDQALQDVTCNPKILRSIEKYARKNAKTEMASFMDWFRTHEEYANIASSALVEIWRQSIEYSNFINLKPVNNPS